MSTTTKRTLSERLEEGRQALESLSEAVSKIEKTEDWFAWLAKLSQLRSYSARNVIYLLGQWEDRQEANPDLPDLSYPASFSAWKALGRSVKKGERGLAVFVPVTVVDQDAEPGDDGKKPRKLIGFGVSRRVFDVSQTEGDVEVSPFSTTLLAGTPDEQMWIDLERFAGSKGFSVAHTEHLNSRTSNGECSHTNRTLRIRPSRPRQSQIKTLAHEIGHMLLHGDRETGHGRDLREVEAESFAYLVCRLYGFASDEYSVGYVGGWSDGDPKVVMKVAERVLGAFGELVDAVTPTEAVPEG